MKTSYLFLAPALWLAACASSTTPTATPMPTPDELLDRAAQAVATWSSAQFALVREGTPAVLDPATNSTFSEAVGQYQAPDRVSATVKVSVGTTVLQIQMLWLPEGNFVTNPLTQLWTAAPPDSALNGAALFGPAGIARVLRDSIQNVMLVGAGEAGLSGDQPFTEIVEGQQTYHLKGEADGEALALLTAGGLTAGTSYPMDVWMETATANIVRVRITEPDGNGWRIDVFAINEPVVIEAP